MNSSISCVIPVYLGGTTIKSTLDSIYNQDDPVDEVLVVLSGPDDGASAIISAHPVNAIVINCQFSNVGAQRNLGALSASSSWITFLDQDDIWSPIRIKFLRQLIAENSNFGGFITPSLPFANQFELDHLSEESVKEYWSHTLHDANSSWNTRDSLAVNFGKMMEGPLSLTCSFMVKKKEWLVSGACEIMLGGADDWKGLISYSMFENLLYIHSNSVFYRIHEQQNSKKKSYAQIILSVFLLGKVSENISGSSKSLIDDRGFIFHQLTLLVDERKLSSLLKAMAWAVIISRDNKEVCRAVARLLRRGIPKLILRKSA